MKQLTVEFPDEMGGAVQLSDEQLASHIKLMAALKMFEVGELSSGKASELAGVSRVEFIEACGRYGVSLYNAPPQELESELKADLAAANHARQ